MRRSQIFLLFAAIALCSFAVTPAFAQDIESQDSPVAVQEEEAPLVTETAQPLAVETPSQGQAAVTESELQWLWGEVVTVDAAGKKLTVKYLNYDTDNEEQMDILLDDKTVLENVKNLGELQPKDTVSIDYIVNASGENLARNINAEKNGVGQELPAEGAMQEPEVAADTE